MLLALSATDQDGAAVENLTAEEVRVGFQMTPLVAVETIAAILEFHHNGPTFGGTGWYSCIVSPPEGGWVQDEVLLCVTVRRPASGGHQNRGQRILLARYHQLPN